MNCDKDFNCFAKFHAGHFLRDILQEEGRDMAWLAANTGMEAEMLRTLMEKRNMDADLFIRIGLPMQPLFLQRVDEMVFGKGATKPVA